MIVYALELTGPFSGGPERLFSTKGKIFEYLEEKYGNYLSRPDGTLMVEKFNHAYRWTHCYRVYEIEVL